jgi:glyoxylase-like metal-dependent hydrolase (beta-lactamase superfamily II)
VDRGRAALAEFGRDAEHRGQALSRIVDRSELLDLLFGVGVFPGLESGLDQLVSPEDLAEMGTWARFVWRSWGGPAYEVERVLADGDDVAGFRVVHAPGHSPGEVIFFRESDRVAICGDVIRNLSYATLRPKLQEPPEQFNWDTTENRRSIRKLAALEPSLILPGHGGAVRDMDQFKRFVDALPTD